ncbi:hypothetical protein [Nostoc sp.]
MLSEDWGVGEWGSGSEEELTNAQCPIPNAQSPVLIISVTIVTNNI